MLRLPRFLVLFERERLRLARLLARLFSRRFFEGERLRDLDLCSFLIGERDRDLRRLLLTRCVDLRWADLDCRVLDSER